MLQCYTTLLWKCWSVSTIYSNSWFRKMLLKIFHVLPETERFQMILVIFLALYFSPYLLSYHIEYTQLHFQNITYCLMLHEVYMQRKTNFVFFSQHGFCCISISQICLILKGLCKSSHNALHGSKSWTGVRTVRDNQTGSLKCH